MSEPNGMVSVVSAPFLRRQHKAKKMLKTFERMRTVNGQPIVDLTKDELVHYTGSGWNLWRFVDGVLVERYGNDSDEKEAGLSDWLSSAIADPMNEVYLALASCTQLCDLRRMHAGDVGGLAKAARLVLGDPEDD